MNIQGGGISFEVSGTNEKLVKILEQSRKAISTFSREGVAAGRGIDQGFEQAAQAIDTAFRKVDAVIDENLASIKELQAQNEKLRAEYAKAFMSGNDEQARKLQAQVQENERIIRTRQQIIDQAKPIIEELNEEDKKLQEQKKHTEENVAATKSLRTQLKECREQLALMEENGQRGSEAYKKMQQEAGRLTNALGDAQAQARILSHDNQLLQGTMSAISGITGGFTAAQGAVALFAGENENLQRVMLKVQSLMSITMGLQQVMNTLNKDSAFQLTIVARAKDMLTAANARLATALGISTAAAQALMATLTLGLSAAITAIVVLISNMSSKTKEAEENTKKFNEEVAKAAGKPLAAYTALKAEWEALTGSMKEREKWVQDNADRFTELGFKVYDVKTAEDVLINNSENFVKACIAKAKALAAQQLAAEKYEEILKKQAEIEAMPDKVTKYISGGSAIGYVQTYEAENSEKKKAQEELAEMQKQAQDFIQQQIAFTQEEQQLLATFGTASAKVVAGSVEAVEAEISRLQQQYKRAANDAERNNLARQIAAEQAKLNKIQLQTNNRSGSDTKKDPYLEMLQKRKTAYAQYSKWAQSEDAEVRAAASREFAALLQEGTSYLDYLEKQRATLSAKAKKTAAELHQLTLLNNEIAEQTRQTVLSDFEAQLTRELQLCKTVGQQLQTIARQREQLANDNSDIDRGKADILRGAESDLLEQARQETAQLLQEYASYTNERIKFEESYARNRELLLRTIHAKEIDGEDEFIKELMKAKEAYAAYAREAASDDATVAASARQRYAELLRSGSSFTEMLRNKIREIEDRQVRVGVEVSGIRQLAALREELRKVEDVQALTGLRQQLRELEDKQVTVGLDVEGTEQLETLRQQIAELEGRQVTVALDVENETRLTTLRQRIGELEDKQVTVGLDVEGREELKSLRAEVRALEDRQVEVTLGVNGTGQLADLQRQIGELEGRIVNIGLDVEDGRQIETLRRQIRTLEDRRVSVGLDVEGYRQLNQLRASLRALEDKQINVVLDVEGTEQLQKLRQLLAAEDVTDAQVQAAIAALAALEKKAQEYAKSSGSAFYDELLSQYRSYQQQQSDIQQRYAAQRAEAEKQGNSAMIAEINAQEQAEMSKLAASRLMASESWGRLFSDLSTLSTKTINRLMREIESKKLTLSAQLNPADLKAVNDQLEKAREEVHKRNPFIALRDSLRDLREAIRAEKLLGSDDPFIKQLQERKRQYEEYAQAVASRDDILARASGQAFANLLRDGSSYIDYLNGKIAELEQKRITIGLTIDENNALTSLTAELARAQTDAVTFATGLNAKIAELQQKKIEIGLTVEENETLQRLEAELAGLGELGAVTSDKWKEAFADLLSEGSNYVDLLRRKIAELEQKRITIGLDVEGEEQLAALQAILAKETGETKKTSEAIRGTFDSVSSSIDTIGGMFDSVVGGMKKMGIQMDEETEHVLGDISEMFKGAGQLAEGIASGNPLSIVQGSVTLLSSAFDLFNTRDRKAERSIEKHQKAVTRLGRAYTQLKHEVDKALGETVYQNQSSMIANLKKQQAETRAMIEDEKSKKKTDWDRVEEWEEQIKEAGRQIEDIMDEITKSVTQTSAGDLANQLADALVEAFESGEEAADAFGKVANDVLKNAVKNALKLQFLEKPLQAAIKQLQRDMGFNEDGTGTFDGLTATEQARFKDAVAKAGANFAEAMKAYNDLFEQLDDSDPSTLSGAIKGASQESIDLLAGQTNAVRMNQVTSLDLLRQQLTRLSSIDTNVSVICGRLLTIINKLTTPANDGLRGQGITD